MNRLPPLVLLLCQFCPLPALAHHSFEAEYDADRPVAVTGVVRKVEWENPHVWVYVEAAGDDGAPVTWKFWEDAPAILERNGISPDVLRPGDLVKVYGFQARDGSRRASAGLVTFEDGRKVFERREVGNR